MTFVVIDIETVENARAKELFQKTVYKPAANLKDPAKIEQSILEKRQKDMDQAALHWWTGKVICLCANVLQGVGPVPEKAKTFIGDDEKELLMSFYDWLTSLCTRSHGVTVVAKSGEYFDLPFLVGRSLVHDIGIPEVLRPRRALNDIDHIFSYSTNCDQRSSLQNYAFGLGVTGKLFHGSEVAGMYAQVQMGDTDQWKVIGAYCAQDTDIATEILKRYLKSYSARNQAEPEPLKPEDIPFG